VSRSTDVGCISKEKIKMKFFLLASAMVITIVPACADPYGIHRPSDMELFRQDIQATEKLKKIRAAEQRTREDLIEGARDIKMQRDRRVAEKGN
jgi:hypothetical protein